MWLQLFFSKAWLVDLWHSYTSNRVSYQKLYEAVKDELVNSFFGPAKTGTYSPSVQNTLYLMAKAVLLRYWFLKI